MTHYRNWTVFAIPVVLFLYFVVGVATKQIGEIFPIYHWGLFATVSTPTTMAEVYLEEVDGRRYNPPVHLHSTEAYQAQIRSNYDIYNSPSIVRRLAAAHKSGHRERSAELERTFEKNFLIGNRVRYFIADVTFHPVERFRTGKVVSRNRVGSFTKGFGE